MIRRILLPLERTDDDGAAIRFLKLLANRRSLEVLLLRIEEWPLIGPLGYGWMPSWRAANLEPVKHQLEQHAGIEARILNSESVPSIAILEEARHRSVSLIMMTYRQEKTWLKRMSGTATARLFHDSSIPVWAIPAEGSNPSQDLSRILYVHDDTAPGTQGARHVIEIAQLFDATVCLLETRLRISAEYTLFSTLGWNSFRETPSPDTRSRGSSQELLLRILAKREVRSEIIAREEDPLRSVAATAARSRADLVILGRTLETGTACSTLARRILEHAKVPVLLTFEHATSSELPGENPPLQIGI